MAICVLLDHGVRGDRIIFVTILAAPQVVYILNRLFPKARTVTGSTDPNLTPIWIPGLLSASDVFILMLLVAVLKSTVVMCVAES